MASNNFSRASLLVAASQILRNGKVNYSQSVEYFNHL